ncbi:O-antigen ligase family protein [Actinophytocola sp.]|uniref:O-antigen ligase family protein n=1 Tax=Actinophytocola sp. TaxID=1872138 RepID=UPI003D6C59C5
MAVTSHRPSVDTPAFLPEERSPRLVGAVWVLLVINTLGSQGAVTVVPIPRSVTQLVTMGALVVAFGLALVLNPRVRLRPSALLLQLSLLTVVSVISSAQLESGYGAFFRCGRLAMFLATLWLLTRWWDDATRLARHHIRAIGAVLLTVVAGMVIAPGKAFPEFYSGRLVGAVWPMTPPQIGFYSATVIGLTVLLWLGGRTTRSSLLLVAAPAVVLLLLTHTRTATIALVAGLAVAFISLVSTSTRARRLFARATILAGGAAIFLGPAIQAWLRRGQDDEALSDLTGRQKVWDALLAAQRTTSEQLFGVGLTNKSYDGLPIDSSWLAVYHEQGLIGVAIVVGFLATLLVVAVLRPPSLERAAALFLILYCLVASYTEAGLGDASPYLLNLAVAAALLHAAGRSAERAHRPGVRT